VQVEERLLDDRGRAYVLTKLRGGMELSDALSRAVFSEFRFRALVPSDTPESRVYDFAHGGLFPEGEVRMRTANSTVRGVTNTNTEIVSRLYHAIRQSPDMIIICEAMNATPPGVPLIRSGVQVLVSVRQVYPFSVRPSSEEELLKVIRLSFAIPHSLVVLSDLGENAEQWACARTTLERAEFEKLAAGFRWGAVGAYDGESYVTWSA